MHLNVFENSSVKKGDIIATVVNPLRKKKLHYLQNKLDLERQELTEYKKKLKTSQKKHEMGISSKNNYLAEKIAYIQFKELYDTTLNEYNTLLLEQKNATIKASQDGVLTNLIAENSYINYGTKIATLIDNDNFVKLFIESSYVNKIKRGMVVHLQSNYQNSDAIIINILPQSSNNLIEAIAKPNKKLPLDLHLTAQIELKQLHGLFIPKEAIVLVNNHPAIYLIDDKNIAHIFFIDIQKDMIDNALITNTLPENAKIALKNAYMLHDNLRVEVRNDAK
ncbi:efflux transporter, RND family, MFP subunit [hydrothermal vent metagenome]|uniref:Efflux transporter, RND family, MFP subunit n=1 Tax=hydrothermal vent metagenome TaxID=652676 RepID=A0A1W1D499_9ZZZZ